MIHLARKPLSEPTVGTNALRHGTGGLNIDACRVGSEAVSTHSRGANTAFPKRPGEKSVVESGRTSRQDLLDHAPRVGRWPANVILQHQPGCREAGVKQVKSHNPDNKELVGAQTTKEVYGQYAKRSAVGHANADGTETVAAWDCVPGCPVRDLDAQSGFLHARGNRSVTAGGGGLYGHAVIPYDGGARDAGGASRFFTQVGGLRKCE